MNKRVKRFWMSCCIAFLSGCAMLFAPDVARFDALVTQDAIAAGFDVKVPLAFAVVRADAAQRQYRVEYEFDRQNKAQHYIVDVNVARAGTLLDPVAFEQRKRADAQQGVIMDAEYPAIGLRAKRQFLGAGPGGAAFGVVFTTSDARFDVQVSVSNLLPEHIADPGFDLNRFAATLSQHYNQQSKINQEKSP